MRTKRHYVQIDPDVLERVRQIDLLSYLREFEPSNLVREIPKSFCSDDETIGLVQEIYGTKVNKGICCVFRYNNLPAKNVLPEYVCDYKKRAGLFQRSADLE